jgi:hypothetical protein
MNVVKLNQVLGISALLTAANVQWQQIRRHARRGKIYSDDSHCNNVIQLTHVEEQLATNVKKAFETRLPEVKVSIFTDLRWNDHDRLMIVEIDINDFQPKNPLDRANIALKLGEKIQLPSLYQFAGFFVADSKSFQSALDREKQILPVDVIDTLEADFGEKTQQLN